MKEMALVAALAVFASLAPALADVEIPPDAKKLEVTCEDNGNHQPPGNVEFTVGESILILICPLKYKAEPAPVGNSPNQDPQVFKDDTWGSPVSVKNECTVPKENVPGGKPNVQLFCSGVPASLNEFYLRCAQPSSPPQKKECKVHFLVKSKSTPGVHGPTSDGGNPGQGSGPTTSPGGVQTCEKNKGPITVRLPEKESVAQFACGSGLILYPKEQKEVYSKDCKNKETLQDMTLTPTTGAKVGVDGATGPAYTLKANKKPAKKTLCYVCATAEATPPVPAAAENSCTIYVESGAGTQYGLSFIVALALPCVLAVFQFT